MPLKLKDVDFWKDYRDRMDVPSFKDSFMHHLKYTQAEGIGSASPHDAYLAAALAVRDRLVERMLRTQRAYHEKDVKRVYYLSLEYLMGRYLLNNLINLKYLDPSRKALDEMGLDLDEVCGREPDAGLGNGGLGRLAACFLDSLATLGYPAYGYGLRYEYGIFRQEIEAGWQLERPDEWLRLGNPWEVARPESCQLVEMDGEVQHWTDPRKRYRTRWVGTRKVLAQPYDTPVVGFGNNTVNLLRLWSAKASKSFNFQIFNAGDFTRAVLDKVQTETITRVLYPNDETDQGKELRFRQQVFFVQATLKDILRRHRKNHESLDAFPEKNAVQLNDTHPALAVSELMRLLIDGELMPWDKAWELTTAALGYTNHTLLPEALEKWPVPLFGRIVPRNLEIVYEINRRFLDQVRLRWPGDEGRVERMSLVEEGGDKAVRMANLAMAGSHSINGVAALHTELLKSRVVPDFAEMYPERFNNKTNGVTQRRWVLQSNPLLAEWITRRIGPGWITALEELKKLKPLADDAEARREFREIKAANKLELAKVLERETGVMVDPASIFDIQIKRIHEYKRQHLNAIHIMALYNRIKRDPRADIPPRTFIFGGKAAPGYFMAKRVIKLINSVADKINDDPDMDGRLKVVFLPNYRVSLAARLFTAADVSEQISTAGKEASGTGNMKFMANGALTLGTLDGANIEIREEVGPENVFIFGMTSDEVAARRAGYRPREVYESVPELREVLDQLNSDFLCPGWHDVFKPIYENLVHDDPFFVLADFESYARAQRQVGEAYKDRDEWTRMALLNTASCGKFSSDRTIRQYAQEIWNIRPLKIEMP